MSNAAIRLGFGIGGAVLGAWTGIGANFGFLAGSLVGGALFPDEQLDNTVTGPRLGDTSVSSSAYGGMITIGFGTMRLPGNMIWSSGIREQENRVTVSAGGAKGGLMSGPQQTQITYSYFASFAMAFAEGPADAILRIWADTKLIYDRRGTTLTSKPGLKFRFYSGTETQLPDPLMESNKGVGRVPAHRGLVYIVFEDLELTDYGNRIPNITVELAFASSDASSARFSDHITTAEGGIYSSFQSNRFYTDPKRRRVYGHGSGGASGWRIFHVPTLSEISQKTFTDASAGVFGSVSQPVVDKDGNIYGNSEGAANNQTVVKVDANSLAVTASFSGGPGHAGKYEAILDACIIHLVDPVQGTRKYHLSWSFFGKLYLLNADTMNHVWLEASPSLAATFRGLVAGNGELGNGKAWIVAHSTGDTNIYIYQFAVSAGANYDSLVGGTIGVPGLSLIATLTPSDWGGGALSTAPVIGPILDQTDGSLIFMIADAVSGWSRVFKWSETAGVVWTKRVQTTTPVETGVMRKSSTITDNKFGWSSAGAIAALIDTTDGTVLLENYNLSAILAVGVYNSVYYEGETQSLIGLATSSGSGIIHQYFIGRAAGQSAVLGDIVAGVSERVGLAASDIDVTELIQSVRGFAITRQTDGRSVIDPLSSAFLFDGIESDDKVKFKVRGRDPERTVQRADLIPLNNETMDVIEEQRVQEPELPRRLYLRFWDVTMDYQQNAVSARRTAEPTPTMRSKDDRTVEMPIVLTPSEAKQIVERWLYTVWNERGSFKWKSAFEHQDLDPSDVITLVTGSGAQLRTRITKSIINTDLSVNFEGTAEDKLSVVSNAIGQGGVGFPQKPPPSPSATQLFMLDTTLLRDVDDLAATASRLYFSMAGYEAGWRGGTLFQSPDGVVYNNTGLRITSPVSWGIVANALPATATPFQTDTVTELRVAMVEGSLVSVTESEFLNDANAALVGSPSTGWELILFKDAVEEADGLYVLSTLIRGRRGTEWFCNSHVNGEYFIFLDRATISSFRLPIGDLDQQDFYKGVGDFQIPEDADPVPFTSVGRDLMPYAPTHLDAVVDGGSNIDLSWVRRTRIGGELRDLVAVVPLSEDAEEYEVEIMDGMSVVRTFTGISTPSKQYDNADIITDFGGVPASLTFRVYQISATVGRGFMAEATITF